MRPVTADLRPIRKVPPALWGFAGVLTVVACAMTWMAYTAELEAVALETELEARRRQEASPKPSAPLAYEPVPYERSAREMLAEYRRPWPEALTALEATEVVGIALNALETPSGEALIRIEVTAVDHAALLEYLAALNTGRLGASGEIAWRLVGARKADIASGLVATIVGEQLGALGAKR